MGGFYSLYKRGSSALAIYFDGVLLGNASSIDFTGAGQTTTILGSDITVNIPGGSAGTQIFNETPSGTVNGVNTIFTLAHTPLGGSLELYANGARQKAAKDFTLVGATITFIIAPPPTSIILADYQY